MHVKRCAAGARVKGAHGRWSRPRRVKVSADAPVRLSCTTWAIVVLLMSHKGRHNALNYMNIVLLWLWVKAERANGRRETAIEV